MKKVIGGIAVLLLGGAGLFAQSGGGANPSPAPKTFKVEGANAVSYVPTRWPQFTAVSAWDNKACGAKLKDEWGLKKKHETHPAVAAFNFAPVAILSEDIDFKKNVGTAYNKTASIVVTWTVRIEGDSVSANPATACSPFHGTTSQKFPGGDALTMLYIKDRGQVGRSVSMTFPDFPDRSSYNPYPPPPPPPSHDPTTTGSVTLTAKDFGGTIPDKFTLEVRWMNDTYGAEITSPANMRNMTITILPIGK